MNTMFASGKYPWTVLPVTDRNACVNALEKASVRERYCAFRGLPRRAGQESAGGRAVAGGAESFARRRMLNTIHEVIESRMSALL
jgi:hypothetical protein